MIKPLVDAHLTERSYHALSFTSVKKAELLIVWSMEMRINTSVTMALEIVVSGINLLLPMPIKMPLATMARMASPAALAGISVKVTGRLR